jgi:hypothetical protein
VGRSRKWSVSRFAAWFDIDWEAPDKAGATVPVPVLGDHYGRAIDAGELRVVREGGSFVVRYHDHDERASDRVGLQSPQGFGSRHFQEPRLAQCIQHRSGQASFLLCLVTVFLDQRSDVSHRVHQRFVCFEMHVHDPQLFLAGAMFWLTWKRLSGS